MKISRERPSQRLHHRVNAPVRVDLPEGVFKAIDWSLGGFSLEDYQGTVSKGDQVAGTIHIPFQGFDISFPFESEVMRTSDQGDLGVRFINLGERELEIMTHFVDELVRGSMTAVDDAILRIDTPVTPVSTKPDPNPDKEIPLKRKSWKAIGFIAFYFTAGLSVAAYVLLLGYTNFFRLEVDTAVVSAPVEPIRASIDGKVKQITVEEGIYVPARYPLIGLENANLEEEIERARIDVNRASMEALSKEKYLKAEQARLSDYKDIAQNEIERLTSRIKFLQKQVVRSRRQVARINTLNKKGYSSNAKLDETEADHAKLQSSLEEVRLLLYERENLLSSLEQGRFYTDGKLEGGLHELQADFEFAQDQILLAENEFSALKKHRQRLVLSAPTQGRILKLLRTQGSTIKKGEVIALFERNEQRTIEAYLTQEEIVEIAMGDIATVFFPSSEEKVQAVVIKIDRTSGFVDEMEARYQWRGPKDRAGLVVLAFLDLTMDEIRERFLPGIPAIVIFGRQNKDEVIHTIKETVVGGEV